VHAAEHPWSWCTKQAPKLFSQFVGFGGEGIFVPCDQSFNIGI
jgi:hypothetical protein